MKKKLVMILALAVAFSITACGGSEKSNEAAAQKTETEAQKTEETKEEKATEAAAEAETEAAEENAVADNAEFSEEQQALAQEFMDMATAYDAVVERVNNCPELLENEELINTMNELADGIIEADEYFADPETLTAEVMEGLYAAIDATYEFIAEAEAALDELEAGGAEAGAEAIAVPVEIVNQTGVDIYALALSPANSDDWGENLITEVIAADESAVGELQFTADTLVWDILVQDAEENQLTFMGVDFSNASVEGAQLVLSASEDGNYYAEIVQ